MAILLIGCTTNLALQISLLLTVYLAMLENDYNEEKVKEMLLWRVETGKAYLLYPLSSLLYHIISLI